MEYNFIDNACFWYFLLIACKLQKPIALYLKKDKAGRVLILAPIEGRYPAVPNPNPSQNFQTLLNLKWKLLTMKIFEITIYTLF